ncbi:MAG TPA: glycosyltransferase family 2 protein [Candidatus Acidoferrum sp.]|nr:glycosyltransferase family 2 protein [Candidatus Acidoferrum sp.]
MSKELATEARTEERGVLASSVAQAEERLPFVTVIVPCRNEEKHIARCLESILVNDYPKDRMEILVLDGMSEDQTREIVASYAEKYAGIRLVDNPKKHIPAAMNMGIQNARGETVIKMDAHSTYQSNHISLCVGYQKKYEAQNVGGVCRMVPGAETAMAKAIVLGLGHRFGSGNANVKVGVDKPTWSDTTAFGCFKRELFERIGTYDENLLSSSDLDLNQRIQAAGGGILIAPDVVIQYAADANLQAFRRHIFADGVWVSYVMKFRKKAWSWRHWVPAAFVLSLLGSLALGAVYPVFLWLGLATAGVYASASLAVSAQIAVRERDARYVFLLPTVFAVRHFAHGAGTLFGLALVALPGEHWKGRRGRKA